MKNIKPEIVISEKFQQQVEGLNIYDQIQKSSEASFAGSIQRIDEELYILKDDQGNDVCGILDCRSFMEALMDTDVSHLWTMDNRKKLGTAN